MSNYLISLTPIGKFFFGGEMTFSANGVDKKYTSYIITSNKFPQQTSLLGMLRFLILRNDPSIFDSYKQHIIKGKEEDAEILIGKKSFCTTENNEYGVIKSIGPCFLQRKKDETWEKLEKASLDHDKVVSFVKNEMKTFINGILVTVPEMKYDSKVYIEPSYSSSDGEIKECDIFKEDTRTGINRDIEKGKVKDNDFFKQVSYQLNEGFRFAFEADVNKDISAYSGQVVSIGADSSQFSITIEELNDKQPDTNQTGNKITLLSPAYISHTKGVKYAITETIPFKGLITNTRNAGPYNKSINLLESSETQLYNTGSVFYLNNEKEEFIKELDKYKNFYKIGYNHYKIETI